jgi:hypothetical protein
MTSNWDVTLDWGRWTNAELLKALTADGALKASVLWQRDRNIMALNDERRAEAIRDWAWGTCMISHHRSGIDRRQEILDS